MVGRGSRTTKEINKENFIVLDLYGNAIEHGLWEQERDWQELFHKKNEKGDIILDLYIPKIEGKLCTNPKDSKFNVEMKKIYETKCMLFCFFKFLFTYSRSKPRELAIFIVKDSKSFIVDSRLYNTT